MRRGQRSTSTPAGRVRRTNGRNSTVPSVATSKALACRVTSATHGMASCEICEPNSLIACPVHSFMKSGWRQRPPEGRRSLRIDGAAVEGHGEPVFLAVRPVGGTEVVDELLQPAYEAAGVGIGEPGAD